MVVGDCKNGFNVNKEIIEWWWSLIPMEVKSRHKKIGGCDVDG